MTSSPVIHLALTLDEADLIGSAVARDRDRLLDDRFGSNGTRLISDQAEAFIPLHQTIFRKIEGACAVELPSVKKEVTS